MTTKSHNARSNKLRTQSRAKGTKRTNRGLPISRRGVASVLAMMFLIIFGSLVAAMAVASTGNIRTANMHLHVMRAMSAAETGLAVAEHRLNEASSRFVLAESDIDADVAWGLWTGDGAAIGPYEVADPFDGYDENGIPTGIAEALVNAHGADVNILTGFTYVDDPAIEAAPGGLPTGVYESTSWVNTPAVLVEEWVDPENTNPPPAYQIRYAPLAGGEYIRVIVEGIVYDFRRNNAPIRRTIMRDYRMTKSVKQAIISHSKILIGKNVQIEGELGARFDEVDFANGDPIVMRSDFLGLDDTLDQKITEFWASLAVSDTDNDNRLRFGHPIEGASLPADQDFDGDGNMDGAYNDATNDGYLDEIDIFIRHYDTNSDNRVTLSADLIVGTRAGLDGSAPEFVGAGGVGVDEDLALLIDAGMPDRNENGVYGFDDLNSNRIYEPADEDPTDYDQIHATFPDEELGWRDGYIDAMDRYAKVRGRLVFKVTASAWETGQGPIGERLRGPIDPDEESALEFGADNLQLPDINASSFADTENALIDAADGDPFWQQVADELDTDVSSLGAWELNMNAAADDAPHLYPVWDDADFDGLPDNSGWAYFEKAPFNSPSYSDVYWRPVFENMVFRNVQIPMGLNGLFVNCTFVGSTHVRTYTSNTHPLWSEYGTNLLDGNGIPTPKFPRFIYGDDASETVANAPPFQWAYDIMNDGGYLLMTDIAISPLDVGDVPQSEVATFGASYNLLPDAVFDIDGNRITDTKKVSNNLRFHDCLFVGSIVSDTPVRYTQVRNKIQFTGATQFTTVHPDEPENAYLNPDENDMDNIQTSSMMLPNYSVDLGTFNSPPEQDIVLQGAIIAGVLDARGNTTIDGALLLTFDPEMGEGPLQDVFGNPIGNPAGFNASLGYFGAGDGDYESIDPADLPIIGGVRIVGYDTTGDGLADAPYDEPQPAGSTPVPFNGFGKIRIRHVPNMRLPSGLLLPISMPPVRGTYQEGAI